MYLDVAAIVHSPALPSLFFFNDTATPEIYTLSLHDALPISSSGPIAARGSCSTIGRTTRETRSCSGRNSGATARTKESRSEEHTSELQSQSNIVCRLLLEKKNIEEELDVEHQKSIRLKLCTG